MRGELKDSLERAKVTDIDRMVYEIICGKHKGGNEVERGSADGPYTEDEVTQKLGNDKWVAARRFGVLQGDKCRQVDDFSRFFVNGCTTVEERIEMDGVDQIVNVSKTWIDLIEMAKTDTRGKFVAVWEGTAQSLRTSVTKTSWKSLLSYKEHAWTSSRHSNSALLTLTTSSTECSRSKNQKM